MAILRHTWLLNWSMLLTKKTSTSFNEIQKRKRSEKNLRLLPLNNSAAMYYYNIKDWGHDPMAYAELLTDSKSSLSLFLWLVPTSGPKGRLKFEAVFTILVLVVDNCSQFYLWGKLCGTWDKTLCYFLRLLKSGFIKNSMDFHCQTLVKVCFWTKLKLSSNFTSPQVTSIMSNYEYATHALIALLLY